MSQGRYIASVRNAVVHEDQEIEDEKRFGAAIEWVCYSLNALVEARRQPDLVEQSRADNKKAAAPKTGIPRVLAACSSAIRNKASLLLDYIDLFILCWGDEPSNKHRRRKGDVHDDHLEINPGTGLPMVGDGSMLDVGGTPYGTTNSDDD